MYGVPCAAFGHLGQLASACQGDSSYEFGIVCCANGRIVQSVDAVTENCRAGGAVKFCAPAVICEARQLQSRRSSGWEGFFLMGMEGEDTSETPETV